MTRALRPHLGAGALEDRERLLEGVARRALPLETAAHLSLDEQCSRALERHGAQVVRRERACEDGVGAFDVAACGEDEAAATQRDGDVPGYAGAVGLPLELRRERVGAVDVPDRDGGFDRVAVDPPDRGLTAARPLERDKRGGEMAVGCDGVARRQLREPDGALPQHLHSRAPTARTQRSPRRGRL